MEFVIDGEANFISDKISKIKKEENEFVKKYKYFKSIISNMEPFKTSKFLISFRFNTPSVNNDWICFYEIIHKYIPNKKSIKSFHYSNFPMSDILSLHHYCTVNNINHKWYAAYPYEVYDGEDIGLYENYHQRFINMEDNIPYDINSCIHIGNHTRKFGEVDIFISNLYLKATPNIELKTLIGQLLISYMILNKKGVAIIPFREYMNYEKYTFLTYCKKYFETSIYKPESSRKTSDLCYVILTKKKTTNIQELLDYMKNPINFTVDRFSPQLNNLSGIIADNIRSSLYNFNQIKSEKDPLKVAKYKFLKEHGEINKKWCNKVKMKQLGGRQWLRVINTTEDIL